MENQNEIFINLPNYGGFYQVSTLGNITFKNWFYDYEAKELRPFTDKNGFKYVRLCMSKRREEVFVHHLVAQVFLNNGSNCFGKDTIDHIDGDKTNNSVENLQIITEIQKESKKLKQVVKPVKKKHIGVTWLRIKQKWMVEAIVNGERTHIGFYKTQQQAIDAYNTAVNDNSK
jgi:hypothetical protein